MSKCTVCKTEMTQLVRIIDTTIKQTSNFAEVCLNKTCAMTMNIDEVTNWKIDYEKENKNKELT